MNNNTPSDKATISPPPVIDTRTNSSGVDNVYPSVVISGNDTTIDEPDYSRERQKPDFVQADDNNFEGA